MTTGGRISLEDACRDLIEEASSLTDYIRAQKLKELKALEAPSELYDDLVSLAAKVCKMKGAALTFVSDDKSVIASAINGPPVGPEPRSESFCNTTIVTPEVPLIIKDARLDDRFKDNWKVAEGLNFYAGVALVTDDGIPVGSLCVFDENPQDIPEESLESLRALSRVAMRVTKLNAKL